MRKLIPLIVLFLALPLQATTYYLDAVSGNDSNDGLSVEEAWETIDKARSTISSGDTVIMRDGSYGDFYHYNAANVNLYTSWVTYQSENLHGAEVSMLRFENPSYLVDAYVKFDGLTVRTVYASNNIKARNFNHLKFLNLDIIGDGYFFIGGQNDNRAIYIWGGPTDDVEIDNCKIRGEGNLLSGFGTGIHAAGTNIVVTNNEITQCHTGITFDGVTNGTITGNTIHNITSDGIVFGLVDTILVEDNEIYDLILWIVSLTETPTNTTWSADGKTMTNGNAQWNTAGDTLITTNMEIYVDSGTNVLTGDRDVKISSVVSDTEILFDKSIGDGGGTPSNVDYYIKATAHLDCVQANDTTISDNVTLRRNKFYNAHGQIVWLNPVLQPSDDAAGGHNWIIENNLFYTKYTSADEEETHTVRVSAIDGLTFRNNIVIGTMELALYAANYTIVGNIISKAERWGNYGAIVEEGYNIVNRDDTDFVYDETSDFFDAAWDNATFRALFTDYDANDFTHAAADSLGVGHGDPTNYPSLDILGNVRNDGDPDAGPYEYGAGPPVQQYLIGINN